MGEDWPRALRESRALCADGRFFEAHDVLEEAWRGLSGQEKLCAQGLVQVCAAFHKASQAGPTAGALELLEKGLQKIAAAPEALPPDAAARVVLALGPALAELRAGSRPTWPAPDWAP